MERVRFIAGIQQTTDIMTGQRHIPFRNNPKRNDADPGFQALLDREMERLKHEKGRDSE